MPIITLASDFGQTDGYVGAMKGVILSICPQATMVDVTHEIPPQDVHRAAHILRAVAPYYPPGTVHIVVVDPGVGSARRPLAIQTDDAFFVGPDNGLFTAILKDVRTIRIVHLDQPRYWRSAISRTFHGRDVFAPVAAHLANGVPLGRIGTPISDPVVLDRTYASDIWIVGDCNC